jgi:hypothetical protein
MLAEFMRRAAVVMREAAAGVAVVLRVSRMAGRERRILGERSGADESSGAYDQRRGQVRSSQHVVLPFAWLLEGLCKFAKLRLNGA